MAKTKTPFPLRMSDECEKFVLEVSEKTDRSRTKVIDACIKYALANKETFTGALGNADFKQ